MTTHFYLNDMDFIENFTIPFYTIQIDDWSIKKQKLLKICDSSRLTNNDDISKVYTDFFTDRNYNNQVYEILSDDISKFSNKVKITLELNSIWFQKYIKGNFHSPHDHGARGYSSICFIDYDENEHNPPRFICPFKSVYGEFVEYTPDNVVEGTMIFFPSMLLHYVLPTTSDKVRTIMSMNFGI